MSTTTYSDDAAAAGPTGHPEVIDQAGLDRIQQERVFDAVTLQPDEASLQTLRDFTVRYTDRFLDRPIYTLAWPSRLYIPGSADGHTYWVTQPPAGNRYAFAWTGATGPSPGSFADKATGNLAAVISPTSTKGTFQAWAGIGIDYRPTARLSEVRFGGSITALGIDTVTVLSRDRTAGYAHVAAFADVFLQGWEINPVTGAWDKLNPFLRHNVYSDPFHGEGSMAALSHPVTLSDSTFGTRFLVEGGKRYALAVTVEVALVVDVRERDDRTPYQLRPGDQFGLEARLGGAISQMTVDTTVVYQA
ncbi:hypothetical protein ASE38_03840 [Cellulomonas sp. Root930]|nr:hypothetical protein ASE38_03840 [Cellulomonas sp. Root930]